MTYCFDLLVLLPPLPSLAQVFSPTPCVPHQAGGPLLPGGVQQMVSRWRTLHSRPVPGEKLRLFFPRGPIVGGGSAGGTRGRGCDG